MHQMILAGSFADDRGEEPVSWRVADSEHPRRQGTFDVTAQIRGVRVRGPHFGVLEPDSPTDAVSVNEANELVGGVLTVEVPMVTNEPGIDRGLLTLTFDLTNERVPHEPTAVGVLVLGDVTLGPSPAGTLEDVLGCLERDPQFRLRCCYTCGLSDYSPSGVELVGMRCHRDAREDYLAVRSKAGYWTVPVTEHVPEFYWCDRWEARQPGTGYRG